MLNEETNNEKCNPFIGFQENALVFMGTYA
jgi:hypothetical protein